LDEDYIDPGDVLHSEWVSLVNSSASPVK
jgi:hypothetical protein